MSQNPHLPQHDQLGPLTRAVEVVALLVAGGLLLLHGIRFALVPGCLAWWTPIVVIAGILVADFLSGAVHWLADTWGKESMPILGRRFLRPFRVHHINPNDFLRRDFIDTNGDVAMLCIPFLLVTYWLPIDHVLGQLAAVFLVTLAAAGLPTNQVHQWAHQRTPPRWVRRLQQWGLLLSREDHQVHHTSPFATYYCISTGWCNRILARLNFFPALERLITRLTGWQPRSDDLAMITECESRLAIARPISH